MKKLLMLSLLIAFAAAQVPANEPAPVAAPPASAFAKGSKNLNFEGSLDFEHDDDFLFDLTVGFGYFPINRVMTKVYLDRVDYGSDSNATGLGLGGYYFQPIKGSVHAFLGARTGWQYIDADSSDYDTYYISPRIGLETLITPTVGLYLQYYHTVQSENVYQNDSGKLDDQDSGLYSGLMIFF